MLVLTKILFFLMMHTIFFVLPAAAKPKKRWEERFGVYDIPSTSLDLFKEDRETHDYESLKNIEEVVCRAVNPQDDKSTVSCIKDDSKKNGIKKASEIRPLKKPKPFESEETISTDLLNLLEQQYDDSELKTKRVSLNLKKVDFREAIELLSNLSGVKFIMDADVEGTVKNFSFTNISLAAALNILLNNNIPRLALLKSFGVWRIVRQRVAISTLKISADQIRESETMLESFVVHHARWDDLLKNRLEKLWQGIMGEEATRSGYYLIFDDYSKKLFFRGMKSAVHDFKKCLREIDILLPQVRIDARVVLAHKDFEEALGFQWSGIYDRSGSIKKGFDFAGIGVGAKNNYNPATPVGNFANLLDWSLNFLPTHVRHGFTVKVPFVFGNQSLDTRRLNLLLEAAEYKSEVKTILKPSMLIKSDEVAEILVGNELPQEVRLTETVEGQPTNITTVSYKDVGMKIKVKPVVSPDKKTVFLDIFVENSVIMPIATPIGLVAAGPAQATFNYEIKTSRSHSRVVLKSEQTTLISGLLVNTKENSKRGIPILSDIPVLNWFFGGSRKAVVDTQLLIFITPTLI